MIHKIKEKIKKDINLIKEKPKILLWYLIPLIITIILVIPLPYYITIGGGTLSLENKIIIENNTTNKGSFNLAYVSEVKGNVLFYILGNIIPSYKIEKQESVVASNENVSDYNFREKIYFNDSVNSATYIAYKKANKEINEKEKSLVIIYVDENSNTDLKVQDIILSINDINVTSTIELSNILNKYTDKDEIIIKVLRDNKEVQVKSNLIYMDKTYKLGITVYEDITYETNPKIEYKFNQKETGPSGGLTIALNIYNNLIEEDITKGYTIVGTGTIDKDGIVGPIGGVKYKLKGAVKSKADIFLVPSDNYDEAIEEKNKNNYKINIISIDTFDDALEKLNNLENKSK